MPVQIQPFYDPATYTVSYVVYEQPGSACAIIDSVLDYDPKSGRTSTSSADQLLAFIQAQELRLEWILETHAHADHLSAAHYLKEKLGGQIGIGQAITQVQSVFKKVFHLEPDFACDGSQFDYLFKDGEVFKIGNLSATAWHVPGHTPADMAYLIDDAVFVGDTIFMPDVGTARCDFPGGNAHTLYQSLQRLFKLPEKTRLFMCHDYPHYAERIAPRWETTVREQIEHNIHVHRGIAESQFVEMRQTRDASLAMPVLILPSIQVNVRAGELPPQESNGQRYLKIPLNVL